MKLSLATAALVALSGAAPAGPARAQSIERAAFVANNGNLEGSVSSYKFNADGTPYLVQKLVIDSTPSSSDPVPGTNAYGISLSPSGRLLAVTHATSFSPFEQVTIVEVAPDATMSIYGLYSTVDSPLDCEWLTDQYLAVTRTSTNPSKNFVLLLRLDEAAHTFNQVDYDNTGGFTAYLAVNRAHGLVYSSESSFNTVRCYRLDGVAGKLTEVGSASSGSVYPLGQGISRDGRRLYAGGGISGGRFAIVGFDLEPTTGSVALMPDSPYISGGESPKQCVVSPYGTHVFAAHGYDSTIRGFDMDTATGTLTYNGVTFTIGDRGSLGEMQVLDDLLLVTDRYTSSDGVKGLLSFTINRDGTLTQHANRVDSNGSQPNQLAVWSVRCPADVNYDGFVDGIDYDLFNSAFENPDPAQQAAADFNHDGFVDGIDYDQFNVAFETGC